MRWQCGTTNSNKATYLGEWDYIEVSGDTGGVYGER